MSIDTLFLFAIALAIASGSPGPSIAALVSRVLSGGWRSVLSFLAAMWIGEAMWLSAAVFGLTALAQTFHYAFIGLKYAGIAYLLYLAFEMWAAPTENNENAIPKTGNSWRLFASGMAITLGNPKIMVFYLALLPSLIDITSIGPNQWLQLVLVMLVVLASVDLLWVATASMARRFLKSPKAVGATNKISASMMAGAAGFLAIRN